MPSLFLYLKITPDVPYIASVTYAMFQYLSSDSEILISIRERTQLIF